MDFLFTRAAIEALDGPVNAMTASLPSPQRVPLPGGDFRWEFPIQSAEVVQVAKAVRMVTSIRAAWRLADEGLTTESLTLLRVASDFAAEIVFLAEGILEGAFNQAQSKFISDYFKPFPSEPDELAAREREYYVGRKDVNAAMKRLAQKAGVDGALWERLVNYANKGHDAYVHGAYGTAMELFSGETHTFMLRRNESLRGNQFAKAAIAGKVPEVVAALAFMARTRGQQELVQRLWEAYDELSAKGEWRIVRP